MEKSTRPNRIKEALGALYEEQPGYFRDYLRRFQEDPTSRVFAPLAEAYRRLGRLDEAITICREGLGHHPEFHGGRVVLAKCLLAKQRHADARVELERVVHSVPENLMAQRLLAEAHLALGHVSAALHAFKMALLLAPQDVALAQRVHELEAQGFGAGVRAIEGEQTGSHPTPILRAIESTPQALPESPEELEQDIPPLWQMQTDSAQEVSSPHQGSTGLQPLQVDSEEDSGIDDEAFKVESIGSIFDEGAESGREITTETLGDLYFSQGQYDRALRIFEKLSSSASVDKKIDACRLKLGVDGASLMRSRKLALLRAVVSVARNRA